MNFSTPNDFKYVTGDLDKIEIDNDIMPVRATEDKRKLRGMDIAFLQEAVEERRRFIGMPPSTKSFDTAINASKLNDIYSSMLPLKGADGCGRFITGSPIEFYHDMSSFPFDYYCGNFPSTNIEVVKFDNWENIVISESDRIKGSDVSSLFSNIAPCVRAEMPYRQITDKIKGLSVSYSRDTYNATEPFISSLDSAEEQKEWLYIFGHIYFNPTIVINVKTEAVDVSPFSSCFEANNLGKNNEFWILINVTESYDYLKRLVYFRKVPIDENTGELTLKPLFDEAKSNLQFGGELPSLDETHLTYQASISIVHGYWEIADLVDRTRWS